MRIGVFGGSFDPVHNGHLVLALTAREQLVLDQVRLVVAREQPLKSPAHAAPAGHRFAMVEQAIAGVPGLLADRREIDRPGPSWTVDTLRSLRSDFPGATLVLLLGSDSAAGFAGWREPEAIRELAEIAVCSRGGAAVPPGFDARWTMPVLELSSTGIRARVRAGLSLAGWVPGSVGSYISGLRLYGSGSG